MVDRPQPDDDHVSPSLPVRVVNVVDLMALFMPTEHPHGISQDKFIELFTEDRHVVFAFHGYPGGMHQVIHGRPHGERFHVRDYREEGTTTTPFDMVVLNQTSRFHLATEALKRARKVPANADLLIDECQAILKRHTTYIREHFEDMPEISDWTWASE